MNHRDQISRLDEAIDDSDEEDAEGEDAAIERNLQSRIYKWSRGLLDFSFALFGYNPFTIYAQANHCEQTSDPNAGSPSTRHSGSLLAKWTKISTLIGVYVAAKTTSALVLRCAVVHLTNNSREPSKPLINLLERILMIIGDPYSCLSSIRMGVYLIGPWWCLAANSVLPYYLDNYHPLNCPFGRFLLEPKREMQIFDLEAKKYLCQMIDAIEVRRLELTDHSWMARICHVNQENTLVQLRRAKLQLRQLTQLSDKLNIIRPKTLRADWHRRSYESFLYIFSACLAFDLIFVIFLDFSYNLITWRVRCNEIKLAKTIPANHTDDNWAGCPLLEAFSPSDLLMMVEIALQLFFIGINSLGFFLVIHFFQVKSQLRLTGCVHEELTRLLNKLHTFNHEHQGQLKVSKQKAREKLDVRVSKSILSMWMFKKVSQANVNFLAQIELIFTSLLFVVTLCVFAILNSSAPWARPLLSGSDPSAPISGWVLVLLLSNWSFVLANSNLILLQCAAIPSRANKMKRTVFLIMAELSRMQVTPVSVRHSVDLQERQPAQQAHRAPLEDPLIALWRRFVLSEMFDPNQPSVQVFSVRLTYQQVLKVNFYVATTISALTLRR